MRLERPGAAPVVGVIMIAMSLLSLIGGAFSLSMIDEMRQIEGALPEQNIPFDVQLYANFAIWILGFIAGVQLMRSDPSGIYLFAATMIAMIALGFAAQPNVAFSAPYIAITVGVLYLLRRTAARPEAPKPALWVTAISTVFLVFTTMGVSVVALSGYVVQGAPEAAGVGQLMIGFAVFGALSWLVGAGVYKFRWIRATLGWPLLAGGLSAGLTAVSFAVFGSDEAFAQQVGASIEELRAMTDLGVGGAVSGGFALAGLALVAMQSRAEARQREADQSAIQEAFR